jgi:membrane protein DedA with SNARE-associated domain
LVAWLAALPPAAIYLAVAFFTALENAFPFVPSDIGVLLIAALLVRDGPLDPLTLGLAATVGNSLGALVPWAIARRFGPRFAQSRTGRRLLPPDLVSFVEREYVRFGLPGIFLCRLLPGIRFIVAPFAGLVGLGPLRTLLPLSLASTVWYALIIGGGWLIGGQRSILLRYLRGVNVGLAVVGVVAIAAVAIWWSRRRRRLGQAGSARLIAALEAAVAEVRQSPLPEGTPIPLAATTVLLVELAGSDEELDPAAFAALEAHAKERWGLGPVTRGFAPGVDYLTTARRAAASTDHAARIALAAQVWRLALADGALAAHEAVLFDRITTFLSLTPEDIEAAKRQGARTSGTHPA